MWRHNDGMLVKVLSLSEYLKKKKLRVMFGNLTFNTRYSFMSRLIWFCKVNKNSVYHFLPCVHMPHSTIEKK